MQEQERSTTLSSADHSLSFPSNAASRFRRNPQPQGFVLAGEG